MSGLEYVDVRHGCDQPGVAHLSKYGDPNQIMARWRCPVCGQRWIYQASFLHQGRMYWERSGGTSRKWRRAEAARLALASSSPSETS